MTTLKKGESSFVFSRRILSILQDFHNALFPNDKRELSYYEKYFQKFEKLHKQFQGQADLYLLNKETPRLIVKLGGKNEIEFGRYESEKKFIEHLVKYLLNE